MQPFPREIALLTEANQSELSLAAREQDEYSEVVAAYIEAVGL